LELNFLVIKRQKEIKVTKIATFKHVLRINYYGYAKGLCNILPPTANEGVKKRQILLRTNRIGLKNPKGNWYVKFNKKKL